ncbi:hypothetical protein G6F57_020345 [Rhizopus arrhizus]|nr:hypothetical protein G6F63_014500 [Rhizopus arrhizus]KAG1437206.1 hypothetical protein G6F57_020345 [Rhizopus arrhizus]
MGRALPGCGLGTARGLVRLWPAALQHQGHSCQHQPEGQCDQLHAGLLPCAPLQVHQQSLPGGCQIHQRQCQAQRGGQPQLLDPGCARWAAQCVQHRGRAG